MASSKAQKQALRKRDRRAGLPPIPSDATPEQRQFFQAVLDNLSVRMGQTGDRKDKAVTFRDLEGKGLSGGTTVVGGSDGDDTGGYLDGLGEGVDLTEGDLVLHRNDNGEYEWASFPTVGGSDGGDVDGGSAASTYTASQSVDGGNASG